MKAKALMPMRRKSALSNIHVIQTVIEIVAIGLAIVGLIYEPAVAKWEEKQKQKVLKALKERKALRK